MELDTVVFYHGISGYHHLLHFRQAESADLIRFGVGDGENWHKELVKLFVKEIAEAAGINPSSRESYTYFRENFKCEGGAFAHIMAQDSPNFNPQLKSRCTLYGLSTYGRAEKDLVKRILEQKKMFDQIDVW